MEEIRATVRSFVSRFFSTEKLQDHDDIFQLGFVNSLFAMQLVAFIEREFNVAVNDEDLDIENFNSVDAMAGFIDRKRAGTAGSAH
jgi:acyl carrier protein